MSLWDDSDSEERGQYEEVEVYVLMGGVTRSGLAVKVSYEETVTHLPISQISNFDPATKEGYEMSVKIPRWLAEEKEFI